MKKKDKSILLINNKIKTGDILLTMGDSLNSKVIAFSSNSKFSHAALLVKDGDDIVNVIEADRDGVYSRNYTIAAIKSPSTSRQEFYTKLPDDVFNAVVLRHKNIDEVSKNDIIHALEKLKNEDLNKRYSKLERLVNISIYPDSVKKIANSSIIFLRNIKGNRDYIYGAFCSEVVAIFYSYLNLEISRHKINPEMISPGFISREKDLLVDVSDAITDITLDTKDIIYEKSKESDKISSNMIKIKETSRIVSNYSMELLMINRKGIVNLLSYTNEIIKESHLNKDMQLKTVSFLYKGNKERIIKVKSDFNNIISESLNVIDNINEYIEKTKNIEEVTEEELNLISNINIQYCNLRIKYLMVILNQISMLIKIRVKNKSLKTRSLLIEHKSLIQSIKIMRMARRLSTNTHTK